MDSEKSGYVVQGAFGRTGRGMDKISDILEKQAQCGVGISSVRDVLISRFERSQFSAHEMERLKRLVDLFDKHPDVLEILELVRDLGVL